MSGEVPFLLLNSVEYSKVFGILLIHVIKLVVLSYVGNYNIKFDGYQLKFYEVSYAVPFHLMIIFYREA